MSGDLKGLYTRQKCSKCNSSMEYMPFLRGVFCKKHPKIKATKDFYIYFMNQRRSFADFRNAENYLVELKRRKENGLAFDDGNVENPFDKLCSEWLDTKQNKVGKSHFENLNRYMLYFCKEFGKIDVADIKFRMVDVYFDKIKNKYASKTIYHMRSCLNSFYKWLLNYEYIDRIPFASLPEIHVEMKYRDIITKAEQIKILNKLKQISFDINPRIWIGVCFLCCYVAIRPNCITANQK